jgi:branched-chain amino acid transport system permease protein
MLLKQNIDMELTYIIQIALGGVLLGGIYGLLSLGMSLNLGLLNIMNLAHGSFLILGALTGYGLSTGLGLPPLLGLIIVPLLLGGLGRFLYPLLIAPLSRREPSRAFVSFLLITLGLAFILEEVTASVLTHPLISLQAGFETWQWKRLILSPLALLLFLVLSGVIFVLAYFLFRTDMGRSLRAVPQDPEGALFIGIPLQKTKAWAWSLGLGAAGLAGVFWILLFPVPPFMGLKLTVMSILMVMAVGPGHIPWAIGAGFFWGIMESTGSAVLGPQWGILIPLLIFLGLLSFFPNGLRGSR